jgi:hypothetical protein
MDGPPSFTEAIRAVASGLREDAHSHTHLNRAAARIDQLGRLLHGLGYVRGREIADCFTAALGELSASHGLPDDRRAEAVHRAVRQLEAALDAAAAGVLPPAP